MKKQLNLLYFSATDRTAKVVKEIAKGINNPFKEYNLSLPANRQQAFAFDSCDLVIVGVPVYGGRVPAFLADYLMKIKGNSTPAIFVTVYGNRHYDDALLELKNIFESNGFIGIAGGAFVGEHSNTTKVGTSRPDTNDLQIAKRFGVQIKEKLEKNPNISQMPKLTVKGNFPYKDRKSTPPMLPETTEKCINCAICAQHCPMSAINFTNFKDIDATKCISCSSCVKRCPVGAKSINHEIFKKITQGLVDNFSTVRHEPELFMGELSS